MRFYCKMKNKMTPEIYSKSIINKVEGLISEQNHDGLTEYLNSSKRLMGQCTFNILKKAALEATSCDEFRTSLAGGLMCEINIENINTFDLGKKGISEQITRLPNLVEGHHRERLKLGIAILASLDLESPIVAIKAFNNELKAHSINPEFQSMECGIEIALKVRQDLSRGIKNDLTMINVDILKGEIKKELGVVEISERKTLPIKLKAQV